ncbi:hypothetical protein PT974_05797 [Cladobotryum mycophilum]|uniref:Uncharacterized protein n=1 Tax=Cladobotryum mycophilum TaxID=491253 RepID=A0ABR0SJS0_9HYPO
MAKKPCVRSAEKVLSTYTQNSFLAMSCHTMPYHPPIRGPYPGLYPIPCHPIPRVRHWVAIAAPLSVRNVRAPGPRQHQQHGDVAFRALAPGLVC